MPETRKKPGRKPLSPDGKRIMLHITLSPGAVESLKSLCEHPVRPFGASAMIEHLIRRAAAPASAEAEA